MNPIQLLPAVEKFLSQPGRLFIGGTWQDAANGRRFSVENPATEHILAEVAEGGERDVVAAVAAARAAFTGPWAQHSPAQRGLLLFRLAELLDQHREELAQLITLENGKPIAAARGKRPVRPISFVISLAGRPRSKAARCRYRRPAARRCSTTPCASRWASVP